MKITAYQQESVLDYLISENKIDIEQIQDEIAVRQRKDILDKHPYKVWHGDDGYWRTYLYANGLA